MRAVFLVIVAGMAAAVAAGCASGGADAAKLEGGWVLEAFGGTTELVPADPGVTSQMAMSDGKVAGSGGVNTFTGTYEAQDGNLEFGQIAATLMAGEPAAMEQEAKFLKALEDTRHFEFDGDKLVLTDTGNNTLMVLTPGDMPAPQ